MYGLVTNRRTRAAKPGWHVSLQPWVAWCLLLVYGIPACLGPHWHHHDQHLPSSTCQSEWQAAPEYVLECSECDCCVEPNSSVSVNGCWSDESALLDSHSLRHVRHSCAICAYYAQAVDLTSETSLAASVASQDFFPRSSESPWLRSILRANSRGPPEAVDLP